MIAETTLGALASLGAAMAWAVTSLLARSLMPELGSVAVNAIRSTIGGALLVVWVLATAGAGAFTAISTTAWVLLALSIVMAIALGDTVFFESTRALGLARAMTISTTYPLGAAAIAAVFLGEPVTLPIAVGALVTLAGLVLIVAPWAERAPEERFWFGVGTAAIASLAWAVSTVLLKPALAETDAVTAQAIRLPLASAALWLTPWARSAPRALALSSRGARVRIVVLGALTSVSSVMFVAGVKHAGVAVASVLSSTAPMFAIPLAVIFLGERLTPHALLGIAITIAGIAVLQL
ncbi:MAG TPA: DMT family transporter [Candidatus Binatia bacterium]|nr:DMT family transporter [Candidatus Binatia bacterium]